MLTIDRLVKKYGKFTAVDELSLTVPDGSIFGFVGPNGAGKTTTMRIMAGLLRATSGSVMIDGVDAMRNPRTLREKIGYMPDFFGVYDDLKVTEYMDFYADAYYIPLKERKELIATLLELVDLSHKRDFYVDSLSRGMKQRLCLARALIHDPKLLILDEPASGLDPRARMEVKEILKQLQTMGKTIVISSHILPELAELCTDIGIIDGGKLAAQGTVHEIAKLLQKTRVIELRPLERMEELCSLLEEQPYVSNLIENVREVAFDFDGDDKALSGLLQMIVTQGIPVLSFREKDGSLEDIFMQITGGDAK